MPYAAVRAMNTFFREQFTSDEVNVIVMRPIRTTDPNNCLAIHPANWVPKQPFIGQQMPGLATYDYRLQFLHKNTSEEEGGEFHATISKRLRTMLYQGNALRVLFAAINESVDGVRERIGLTGVRQQRFLSTEMSGSYNFLSTIEYWTDVESFPTS